MRLLRLPQTARGRSWLASPAVVYAGGWRLATLPPVPSRQSIARTLCLMTALALAPACFSATRVGSSKLPAVGDGGAADANDAQLVLDAGADPAAHADAARPRNVDAGSVTDAAVSQVRACASGNQDATHQQIIGATLGELIDACNPAKEWICGNVELTFHRDAAGIDFTGFIHPETIERCVRERLVAARWLCATDETVRVLLESCTLP